MLRCDEILAGNSATIPLVIWQTGSDTVNMNVNEVIANVPMS